MAALKKRLGESAPEKLPANAVLVVDGDGWVFEVLKQFPQSDVLYGGDYHQIDSAVRKEVKSLQDMGFQLVFYFGRGYDLFKDETMLDRTRQREEMWMNVYTCCREKKISERANLPIPTLGTNAVRATLVGIKSVLDVVVCEEESDQMLAGAVCHNNRKEGKETYFCYGKDRLVYKEC